MIECFYCLSNLKSPKISNCGHSVCESCSKLLIGKNCKCKSKIEFFYENKALDTILKRLDIEKQNQRINQNINKSSELYFQKILEKSEILSKYEIESEEKCNIKAKEILNSNMNRSYFSDYYIDIVDDKILSSKLF